MVTNAVATDLKYITQKSIIVDIPRRPGQTVDLAVPRSYLRMLTAADTGRIYFMIAETFINSLIETILLTCRSRGEQVNVNRLKIADTVRQSLINLCQDVKKVPKATKDQMFAAALKEGFVPPGQMCLTSLKFSLSLTSIPAAFPCPF
ncbi:hypothetical protein PENTCL1PPCAC_11482 [Pristionchus entomophagus]|uniref:Transcription factor CBF/NF-Y/archaeal histone domain-containing protein n=1 Tax=Pristionchus entomophagus TaxID=358040 RepID=A0AAV5T2J9_9BILA|nr:hypothetical protein PENTCL1PPCAC_11480 [Pristionchus entomophagus]GMS89307.1 hypothetical protein PENTCL1PPCAC_11482 [Pristionchus entomophagus]